MSNQLPAGVWTFSVTGDPEKLFPSFFKVNFSADGIITSNSSELTLFGTYSKYPNDSKVSITLLNTTGGKSQISTFVGEIVEGQNLVDMGGYGNVLTTTDPQTAKVIPIGWECGIME